MTATPHLNDEHGEYAAAAEHETTEHADIGPVLGCGSWSDDSVYLDWLRRQQHAVAIDRLRRSERLVTPSISTPDLLQIHLPGHRDHRAIAV